MYGKIFESMYDGTISINWKAMIVFQQMIILCDSDGVIDMTAIAISRRTNIPLDIIEHGIEFLSKPDPHSRSTLHEGKRIIPIDESRSWGWIIVNHSYYRNLASKEDKREKDRKRIAEKRKQESTQVIDNKDVSHSVACCRKQSQMSPIQDTNTDTNIKKQIPSESSENPTGISPEKVAVPYQKIVDTYHAILCNPDNKFCLPRVEKLTPKRKTHIRQRWLEDMPSVEQWENYFVHVSESHFLTGRVRPVEGRKTFRADIDFLINQSNLVKIAEGKYH